MSKSRFINIFLVLLSLTLTLVLCEYIFRSLLFNDKITWKGIRDFRRPTLYAADWDENYWKLLEVWKKGSPVPKEAHPLLGWTNYTVWPNTLFHKDIPNIGKKRPVLLFGDSFSMNLDKLDTSPEFFNNDSTFLKENYLINYSCGGYGLDQMYTLYKNVRCKFAKPLVIFSFLTMDLDRTPLTFYAGQKPHYSIDEQGKLQMDTSIYEPYNTDYLKKHPPVITSYLLRKFLFGNANFLSKRITESLTGEHAVRETTKKLNLKILQDLVANLRKTKTDFMFLIWEAPVDYRLTNEDNWRTKLIEDFVSENSVKCFWAKDALPVRLNISDSAAFYKYYILNDGHPTMVYNKIIINRLKELVLNKDYETNSTNADSDFYNKSVICHPTFEERIDSVIGKIKNDPGLYEHVIISSKKENEPLDKTLFGMAIYEMWREEGLK